MTRRFEAGPALVALGALALIVSLFLDWYDPGISAWSAFEVLDLLLTALAVAALVAAIGLLAPELGYLDRAWLPWTVAIAVIVVASQLVNPPPAAAETDPALGAWLALAGSLVMAVGTVLTFGRVHFAVEVEGRDPRRRVAAVDARREDDEPAAARAAEDDAPRGPWGRPRRDAPSPEAPSSRGSWGPARRDREAPGDDDPLATQPIDEPEGGERDRGGGLS